MLKGVPSDCSVLRRIEHDLGRIRTDDKYAPRTIDLDILVYDDLVVETDGVVIPDPEIANRPFLAIPLCELDPGLTLPDSGLAVCDLAGRFAPSDMEPLREYTDSLRDSISGERASEHGLGDSRKMRS
jgi:7,8-dihydro-6-hydroxymethylpterin-pyrophosphokinase